MRRKWLRPLACVALVAFLAAGTPAVTAGAARPVKPPPRPTVAKAHKSAPCGCRCARHQASGGRQPPEGPANRGLTPPARPGSDSHCPDCPGGPDGSHCPFPGGCPLCNAVKVPCLVPPAGLALEAPCLGASRTETPPLYTPPFAATLTPPPRA
jgi:hypothetical protein